MKNNELSRTLPCSGEREAVEALYIWADFFSFCLGAQLRRGMSTEVSANKLNQIASMLSPIIHSSFLNLC
jgi:hypothetical protein